MPPVAVKELDLLVHPFFMKTPAEKIDLWKSRIDKIARNKNHYLAVRLPLFAKWETYGEKAREVITYAKEKLGEQRVIVAEDSTPGDPKVSYSFLADRIREIGFDPQKIRVHVYGEWAHSCVLGALQDFVPLVVPRQRTRQAVRVLLDHSTVPGSIVSRSQLKSNAPELVPTRRMLRRIMQLVKEGKRFEGSE